MPGLASSTTHIPFSHFSGGGMIQDGTRQMTLASQLPQTLLIFASPPGQAHVF
jgi:hypothetical protein